MGQVLDKVNGKGWREQQIRRITDRVFDRFKNESGGTTLTFEEIYIAVLLVYNDINKRLPGPHFDPPSKALVKAVMQECDINLDGELNPEEFAKFIKSLTKDTFYVISQGLLVTLAVAPTIALLTKRTTEGLPGIGKMVEKVPTSVYASLVTLGVVMFQKAQEAKVNNGKTTMSISRTSVTNQWYLFRRESSEKYPDVIKPDVKFRTFIVQSKNQFIIYPRPTFKEISLNKKIRLNPIHHSRSFQPRILQC